jgi:hypothetical protein
MSLRSKQQICPKLTSLEWLEIFIFLTMAPIPVSPAYGTTTTDSGDVHWYSMKYNGLLLKYTLEFWGQQPVDGYPLYVGLHGGGSANVNDFEVNDGAWADMAKFFYHEEVKTLAESNHGTSGAAYVALRGISSWSDKDMKYLKDEYNLHWRSEGFVLIQQLLWNLLAKTPLELSKKYESQDGTLDPKAPHFINSNKVHLMGFSAGGDGAFNIARCLPDLFATVVPAAGYATDAANAPAFFENYANLPCWLQVGEQDNNSYVKWKDLDSQGRSERAKFYYHYDKALRDLRGKGENYLHKTEIVQGGHHAEWFDPQDLDAVRPCIRNLDLWFADATTAAAKLTDPQDLNAVKFPDMFNGRLERSTVPHIVVWNLNERPTQLDADVKLANTKWETKRFFYWLFDRKPSKTLKQKPNTFHAAYHTDSAKEETTIRVKELNDYIGLLLREPMVSFKHPITIKCGDWSKQVTVNASDQIKGEVFNGRGDANLVFSAMVYFEQDTSQNWEARVAATLTTDGGEAVIGKLVQ